MANDLAQLHQKIDLLTNQVAYLTEQTEVQQRRQQEFDELKQDMIPIANHMIKLSIDELADVGQEFEVEDLLFCGSAHGNLHVAIAHEGAVHGMVGRRSARLRDP